MSKIYEFDYLRKKWTGLPRNKISTWMKFDKGKIRYLKNGYAEIRFEHQVTRYRSQIPDGFCPRHGERLILKTGQCGDIEVYQSYPPQAKYVCPRCSFSKLQVLEHYVQQGDFDDL